ncbi:Sodium-dependent glucose transporter 1 [Fasciola gigantica]|uniref:Sodium-dependent glucose transporter 1 n=1 Tax=Fasciola gigantica TaxID=46835 RepID=A0A504YQI3_FASGI|nr:Sodium-dependent glucose transporter 1 [Fasciola gigantica]
MSYIRNPENRRVKGCFSCAKNSWAIYAKTAALVYSWTSLGLYSEILGPTLPTLMFQTNSNYEQVGLALSIRSVGLLSGSLVGGLASDKWKQQRAFLIVASLGVAALTNAVIPWIRTLAGLATVLYVAGFSHGFHTTSGNPLLGSVWGLHAAGPFSLMHAGYGLGAAVAPLLVAPFTIRPDETNHTDPDNTTTTLNDPLQVGLNPITALLTNTTESAIIRPAVPYNVVAVILLLCAACFIFFNGFPNDCQMCHSRSTSDRSTRKRPKTSKDDSSNPIRAAHYRTKRLLISLRATFYTINRYDVFLVLGTFIIYFAVVGNERVFGKFMFTYALYGPIQMNTRLGYVLHLAYWVGFGLARILTCFLALIIPARMMLGMLAVGTLLVSVGLILIPSTSAWFFTFTCLFSLFKSPLFPSTLAAINLSHEITGLLVLVVNLGSACGATLLQYTAGTLIQHYGQFVFPYLVCGSACVVLLTAFGLIFVLRVMGDRCAHNPNPKPDPVDNLIASESDEIQVLRKKSESVDNLSVPA